MSEINSQQNINEISEVRTQKSSIIPEYEVTKLNISLKHVIKFLSIAVILFTILSLSGQAYRYFFNDGKEKYITQLFNLDKEMNFPTYFSSGLLLFCSMIFMLIAWGKKKLTDNFSINWFLFSIVFLIMSMDEILMLHEQLSAPIRMILDTHGFFYFAWLVPAGLFLILFSIFNFRFLLSLKQRYQFLFISSAFVYLSGAFLMEMVGGKFLSFYGQNNFGYVLTTTIEEVLEMSGLLLLLYTLMVYIKNELPFLNITINDNLKS